MAIKMRNNTKPDSVCCECGNTRKKVLDMFDIQIGGNILTICDECNSALLYKALKAECYKNGRIKSKEDMAIIHERGRTRRLSWDAKESQERKAAEKKQKASSSYQAYEYEEQEEETFI